MQREDGMEPRRGHGLKHGRHLRALTRTPRTPLGLARDGYRECGAWEGVGRVWRGSRGPAAVTRIYDFAGERLLGVFYDLKSGSSSAFTGAEPAGVSGVSFACGLLEVTDSGLAITGVETNTPSSPEEVFDIWRRALPAGPLRMLEALRAHPDGLTRDELAARAGFSPSSSSVGSHLKKLRDNGLAVVEAGNVHASHLILDRPEPNGGRTR